MIELLREKHRQDNKPLALLLTTLLSSESGLSCSCVDGSGEAGCEEEDTPHCPHTAAGRTHTGNRY